MRFTDIPTERFPLNFDKYRQLADDIQAASSRFNYVGTSDAKMVSSELMAVHSKLASVWELIRRIERREKGE